MDERLLGGSGVVHQDPPGQLVLGDGHLFVPVPQSAPMLPVKSSVSPKCSRTIGRINATGVV